MGILFSCPFAEYSDVESGLESIIVKSISFGDDDAKTLVRSIGFKSQDSETTVPKSSGSEKMMIEASVSFKNRKLEKMVSVKAPSLDKENHTPLASNSQRSKLMDNQSSGSDGGLVQIQSLPILDPAHPQHGAALKLQKVYKSFRTRRKLADCAVLVEQSWWKLLDFAELKRSSISFFDIEKHETAISRWSRARTRAAKVGKGLSKNDRAQKLALQHWLEAIDPRHRYGHNLHFYYVKWLHSQSIEPFFYWLDIGEGKEINIVEKCPRSKLQQQCIKYLGPMERLAYEVVVEDGMFLFKQSRELLHTTGEPNGAKWIFVLSTSMSLYVGKKKKGTFQHSSFLAGGATSAAGRLVIENGILKAVWPHSGHYQPTEENFKDFISFLKENKVDLRDVKMSPIDDEDELFSKQGSSVHFRTNSSEEDLTQKLSGSETEEVNAEGLTPEKIDSMEEETAAEPMSIRLSSLSSKLANLEIPKRRELYETLESEKQDVGPHRDSLLPKSPVDGYEAADEGFTAEKDYMDRKQKSFNEQHEGSEVEIIPEESILKRINSHKGLLSYQLGKQLSCKWTTGAGPRIGCVRDYPSELQCRALEQVNLSPRSTARSRSCFTPRFISGLTPSSPGREMAASIVSPPLEKESFLRRIDQRSRTKSSPLIRGTSVPSIPDDVL